MDFDFIRAEDKPFKNLLLKLRAKYFIKTFENDNIMLIDILFLVSETVILFIMIRW